MAKNSIEAYGAEGKSNVLFFDPEKLTLITDETSALYCPLVHLPVSEPMVLNIMALGVRTPISVAKNPETGAVEVVAGWQRVKAAREANRRLVARGEEPIQIAVRDAVEAGTINIGHAKAIAKLAPEVQREKVAELVQAGEGATGHEKARKQRAVVETVSTPKPKMRSRAEVQREYDAATAGTDRHAALAWVLGIDG